MDYLAALKQLISAEPKMLSDKLRKASFELEDSLLLDRSMPHEALDFVLSVLGQTRLTSNQGIAHVFAALLSDWHKFDDGQRLMLLRCVEENAENFDGEIARWAVADFVARGYDVETALNAFENWSRHSNHKVRNLVPFGCSVLLTKDDDPPPQRVPNLM